MRHYKSDIPRSRKKLDKKILEKIQSEFPVVSRPFEILAKEFDVTEGEVIERIRKMKTTKAIRRISALFDSKKLGYISALIATKVAPERIEEVAAVVNTYSGVTHNYLRDHPQYNLWFTLTAQDRESYQEVLEEIKALKGVQELHELPALLTFKLRIDLEVEK